MGADDSFETSLSPLVLIIFLNVVILLLVVVLHELGHALFGIIRGCENVKIILFDFETFSAYTAMDCGREFFQLQFNLFMMSISSFFTVLPVAIILLLFKNYKIKSLGIIVLGANIAASAYDFQYFYGSTVLKIILIMIGIMTVLYGEKIMINKVFKEEVVITTEEITKIIKNTENYIKGEEENDKQDTDRHIGSDDDN